MNRKGKITNISSDTVRVVFEDIDTVSYELKIARHINILHLEIGEEVIVSFYNNNLESGIVIAELR